MIPRLFGLTIILPAITWPAAAAPIEGLPTPDYEPAESDPGWLVYAAQFHGHLGPWAAAGLRAGKAGREAVGARGYFDLDVTVEGPLVRPPRSCFLDGIQVATGATLGKRNLHWVEREGPDSLVVRVRNTRSGRTAEVRLTPALMRLLTSFKPHVRAAGDDGESARDDEHHAADDHQLESLARRIARAATEEILAVEVSEDRDWQ